MSDIEPRKRPRQTRSVTTVAVILEAAAHILERDGLDALTTNAVAERAGVSIGSLYQYFPGKAALLAELIRSERTNLAARIDAIAATPPRELGPLVVLLINAAVDHQLARPAFARALDFAEQALPLDEETAALSRYLAQTIANLLAPHKTKDGLQAARDLVALAKGMIDAAGLAGETDRAGLAQRVIRAALGYLRPITPTEDGH
jgi:AcrR family transcriptional regulator